MSMREQQSSSHEAGYERDDEGETDGSIKAENEIYASNIASKCTHVATDKSECAHSALDSAGEVVNAATASYDTMGRD